MVNIKITLIIFFTAEEGEALKSQQKQDLELTRSDHQLLIAKFRLKLQKVVKTTWRGKWQPTSVFLPGKSHEQRSLVGYSPWDHKELDMT